MRPGGEWKIAYDRIKVSIRANVGQVPESGHSIPVRPARGRGFKFVSDEAKVASRLPQRCPIKFVAEPRQHGVRARGKPYRFGEPV